MRRITAVTAGLMLIVPVIGQAQRCEGTASFAAGMARIGAGMQFTDGAKAFGGTFAIGKPSALYASGGYTHTTLDNSDVTLNGVSGTLGYQVDLGEGAQVCPLAGVAYTSTSVSGGGATVEASNTAFGLGFSLGGAVSSSASFELVPSVGFQYFFSNSKAAASGGGQTYSGTDSDSYGAITLNAGFVFNKSVTLLPMVAFPVGVEGGKAQYGIGIGLNFGQKGQP